VNIASYRFVTGVSRGRIDTRMATGGGPETDSAGE
jgi:hypothetical protein